MSLKIAFLDDYQQVVRRFAPLDRLPPGAETVVFDRPIPVGERASALAPFEVIVAMRERTPFDAGLIVSLPRLRLLVTTGMRNAAIDLDACRARGVLVCGTGAVGAPAAELTWALILTLLKRVTFEERALREGGWQLGLTRTVEGLRLGVVGLGKLGTKVARIGAAFGMDVVAWSPNLTDERAAAVGVRRVEKGELFATADVVSLHLVLSERTRRVVGAEELALMKPKAYLVNTARAGLVDEDALLSALRERRIAGAGLDVFSTEPLPLEHPLRTVPNTVLTPHLGYVTEENYAAYFRDAVEDISSWQAGTPVRILA